MNFLLINGSLTDGGNTAIMVQEFKRTMEKKNHIVSVYDLVKGSDELEKLIKTSESADVLVFASPIYWGGMTGILKAFIDRLNPELLFYKNLKYGAALVNSEYESDSDLVLNHFRLIFKYLGIEYIDSLLITDMKKKGDMKDKFVEIDNYASWLSQKIR